MLPHGSKKIKIRPPRRAITEIDYEKSWSVLSNAITQIQNKNASKLSFEDLYRKSYNIVLKKLGSKLYENVKELVKEHLLVVRQRLLTIEVKLYDEADLVNMNLISDHNKNEAFLKKVNDEWEDHTLCMKMISDVLMYLDRVYAKENKKPLIYDAGLSSFRDNVIKFNSNEIGFKIIKILNQEIFKSRQGEIINKFLIKNSINMLEKLSEDDLENGENYYLRYFEPTFLQTSSNYFMKISDSILELKNGSVYIEKIHQFIKSEENRIMLYLPSQTFPNLIKLMDNILIADKIDSVMKFEVQGLNEWLATNNYQELNIVFELISRIDSDHNVLKAQLKEVIVESGKHIEIQTKEELMEEAKSNVDESKKKKSRNPTQLAIKWIENILLFKDKYDLILRKSLQNNPGVEKTISMSISEFVNLNKKIAEFLSLFIDYNIKQLMKNKNEEECDTILEKAIIIFNFIQDKDSFSTYYQQHLAKRLMNNFKGISVDVEKSIISRIKLEMGSDFTKHLEFMFQDINISKDYNTDFMKTDIPLEKKFDFELLALTENHWPMKASKEFCDSFKYPEILENMITVYNDYYSTKKGGGVVLRYLPMHGHIDIRIKYPSKTYEINMATYSGIIMLLFEDHEELSYEEISEKTKIPESDLKRHLQSLAVANKTRLLLKKPMTKDINPGDKFCLNKKFKSPMTKIRVLTVASAAKVEDDREREATMEKISESREMATDAAIVRIMKSRKTLSHNELMAECIKQLNNRFKPSPSLIKNRIESLFHKEYLSRDEENIGIYHYVA